MAKKSRKSSAKILDAKKNIKNVSDNSDFNRKRKKANEPDKTIKIKEESEATEGGVKSIKNETEIFENPILAVSLVDISPPAKLSKHTKDPFSEFITQNKDKINQKYQKALIEDETLNYMSFANHIFQKLSEFKKEKYVKMYSEETPQKENSNLAIENSSHKKIQPLIAETSEKPNKESKSNDLKMNSPMQLYFLEMKRQGLFAHDMSMKTVRQKWKTELPIANKVMFIQMSYSLREASNSTGQKQMSKKYLKIIKSYNQMLMENSDSPVPSVRTTRRSSYVLSDCVVKSEEPIIINKKRKSPKGEIKEKIPKLNVDEPECGSSSSAFNTEIKQEVKSKKSKIKPSPNGQIKSIDTRNNKPKFGSNQFNFATEFKQEVQTKNTKTIDKAIDNINSMDMKLKILKVNTTLNKTSDMAAASSGLKIQEQDFIVKTEFVSNLSVENNNSSCVSDSAPQKKGNKRKGNKVATTNKLRAKKTKRNADKKVLELQKLKPPKTIKEYYDEIYRHLESPNQHWRKLSAAERKLVSDSYINLCNSYGIKCQRYFGSLKSQEELTRAEQMLSGIGSSILGS